MDSATVARVSLSNLKLKHATVLRLVAPAADSKTGVTFGGAIVGADGRWKAVSPEQVRDGDVAVSPMSAAVLLGSHASGNGSRYFTQIVLDK